MVVVAKLRSHEHSQHWNRWKCLNHITVVYLTIFGVLVCNGRNVVILICQSVLICMVYHNTEMNFDTSVCHDLHLNGNLLLWPHCITITQCCHFHRVGMNFVLYVSFNAPALKTCPSVAFSFPSLTQNTSCTIPYTSINITNTCRQCVAYNFHVFVTKVKVTVKSQRSNNVPALTSSLIEIPGWSFNTFVLNHH